MVGPNDERFGPRFFSLANAYDRELLALLKGSAQAAGIRLHEGVYAACPGPNFETAAEIRMMSIMGADLVGMSLVPEVIAARHCGLKVTAVSVVTNLAEGLGQEALSHEQTLKYAAIGAKELLALLRVFVADLALRPVTPVSA
jgi:xanthosine phosphorylase